MKNLFFIMLVAIPSMAMAAPPQDLDEITKAIGKGDVSTLSKYLATSVEIAILDEEDIYDKSEAVEVLKSFFENYKPSSYSQVHKGTSKGQDSKYLIGNYQSGGESYRVYLYLSASDGNYRIQELRFDKE